MPRTRPLLFVFAPILVLLAPPLLAAAGDTVPTYSRDVAPILNESCVSCHRPNQIGPMSLQSYEEVRPWAKSVARNVENGEMPPWHADPEFGRFANDRSLEPAEVDAIVRWAANGAPEGDPADLPPQPELPTDEWLLGEPDLIVTLDEVQVPAGKTDLFPKLVGKVMLPEDRWIRAVEIMPGNRKVVHHVISFQVKGFDVDPQGGWIGAWAAGTDPMVFPEGTGRLLEKGANILADMHYHPADTDEVDQTRIGLHFHGGEVGKELVNVWINNDGFEIPAGEANHEVRASYTFWQGGKIMGLIPHMHYRGRDFSFTANYPDGSSEVLLRVPRWDFNWQTSYQLAEPISVPAGTRVETVAHYDNSTANPDNPDPKRDVGFGLESYDEMMIGFVDFVVDEGVRPKPPQELRAQKLVELGRTHPGDVYAVSAGDPQFVAPLYLPRDGNGTFFVIYDGQLVDSTVSGISWQGDRFEATVEALHGRTIPLTGQLNGDGTIETLLGETPFNGSVYRPEDSTSSGL
jgi:mono/diheme cytochrome c family protein